MPYKDPAEQLAYQNRWMAARRAEYFDHHPCVDCGATDGLQLDHVDPSKKVSHRIWSWSKARRDAELAKCVSRCQPCHVKKSVAGFEQHGQAKMIPEQVREIRKRYAQGGVTQKQLAAEYGLLQPAISKIILGQRWASIPT